ncbi:endonuclease domain-containing protein [Permianibacter sp. IMCC34836]|uniref:endonuclease domain-containing protein n=1 Tax=Permianibacter fluminis TaxID=2738515 RepID=UPI001553244F|nr:endonuclease domain-containing protein [Permianibacter fluminis]NQD35923.1 endonuclease domain-containing protein [Permianibacter fluminis]
MGFTFNRKSSAEFRRELRNNPTAPEHRLWQALRGEQLGVKFRRQHNMGSYIVDFYCAEARLVIEVDGDSHYTDTEARQYDSDRDAYLAELGLQVVRVTNQDVIDNLPGVLQHIAITLQSKDC